VSPIRGRRGRGRDSSVPPNAGAAEAEATREDDSEAAGAADASTPRTSVAAASTGSVVRRRLDRRAGAVRLLLGPGGPSTSPSPSSVPVGTGRASSPCPVRSVSWLPGANPSSPGPGEAASSRGSLDGMAGSEPEEAGPGWAEAGNGPIGSAAGSPTLDSDMEIPSVTSHETRSGAEVATAASTSRGSNFEPPRSIH
jgi:hypothetical protein